MKKHLFTSSPDKVAFLCGFLLEFLRGLMFVCSYCWCSVGTILGGWEVQSSDFEFFVSSKFLLVCSSPQH